MANETTKTKIQSKTPSRQPTPAPLLAPPTRGTPLAVGSGILQQTVTDPAHASPTAVLALQRLYGNRAVQRLLTGNVQGTPVDKPTTDLAGPINTAASVSRASVFKPGARNPNGAKDKSPLAQGPGHGVRRTSPGITKVQAKLADTATVQRSTNKPNKVYAPAAPISMDFAQAGEFGQGELLSDWESAPVRVPPMAKMDGAAVQRRAKYGFLQREFTTSQAPVNDAEERWKKGKQEKAVKTKPTTIDQVAEGADANAVFWISHDDVLWDILKGPFESHWFKARESLTLNRWPTTVPPEKYPNHETSLRLMNGLVDMRWRKWRPFADAVLTRMKHQVAHTANKPAMAKVKPALETQSALTPDKDQAKIFNPVGSQAVTSDIDLSMGGKNSEIAVGFINQEFRKQFNTPYDPGTVFDINVYASDWIHGADETGEQEKLITPKPEVAHMSEQARSDRDERMEIWSLVKARRNMEDQDWVSYTRQLLAGIGDAEARKRMQKKLSMANFEFNKFQLNIKMKMREIEHDLDQAEKKLYGGGKSAYGAEYQESARETRASNAIYEDLLLEVKALRLRLGELAADPVKNAEAINNLGMRLGSKIAEALTYANEVYATEGAVQHTVLEQGKGKKLQERKGKGENITSLEYNLRPQLFMQSVNENVGDSLHSLHAYHDVPRYSVYRAGKYIARLIEATEKALAGDVSEVPHFAWLKKIGQQAMAIKSTKVMVRDQEMEGDPAVVDRSEFFRGLDVSHTGIHTLTQQIIAFGAKVPSLFHMALARKAAQPSGSPQTLPASPSILPTATAAPVSLPPPPSIKKKIGAFQKLIDDANKQSGSS